MIINSIIAITMLSISLQSAPQNLDYKSNAEISYNQKLETLVFKDVADSSYCIETTFGIKANMSYNASTNKYDYVINNVVLTIEPSLYFVKSNGEVELEHKFNYVYESDYVLTKENYTDIKDFNFVVGVNNDDEMYLNVYEGTTRIEHLLYDCDESIYLNSNATFTIDASSFETTIQNYFTTLQNGYNSGWIEGYANGWNDGDEYAAEVSNKEIENQKIQKHILIGAVIGASLISLTFFALYITNKLSKKEN